MGPKGKGGKTTPVPPLSEGDVPKGIGDIGGPAFPLRVPVVPEGNNPPTTPGRAALSKQYQIYINPVGLTLRSLRKFPRRGLQFINRKLNFLYKEKLKGGANHG